MMRAATAVSVSSIYRAYALAFALGLAFLGMGVGLAHADSHPPVAPQQTVQGLLPSAPNDSFVCHARPGGWCDLRDWRGFGQTTVN
jgi:hypothetical protein